MRTRQAECGQGAGGNQDHRRGLRGLSKGNAFYLGRFFCGACGGLADGIYFGRDACGQGLTSRLDAGDLLRVFLTK